MLLRNRWPEQRLALAFLVHALFEGLLGSAQLRFVLLWRDYRAGCAQTWVCGVDSVGMGILDRQERLAGGHTSIVHTPQGVEPMLGAMFAQSSPAPCRANIQPGAARRDLWR